MGERLKTRWFVLIVGFLACAGSVTMLAQHVAATLTRSAPRALARSFGSGIKVIGDARVHLLPRPHVTMSDVRFEAPDAATIDVPTLEATPSLASLLTGRVAFSRVRLLGPRATVNADTLMSSPQPLAFLTTGLPTRVTVQSGTVTIHSRHTALRGVVTDLDAVVNGLDRNGPAESAGQGTWRGTRFDVSARLGPFYDFVLGRETTGSLQLRSPLLSLALDGHLHAGVRGGFEGQVSASMPSLPNWLRMNDLSPGLGRLVERVSFTGSGLANTDTITFSNARATLDDTRYEGSLAWQPNGGRWAWTGTFATDTLDLTRGLAALPALRDRSGRWSDAPWSIDPALLGDVDLRVSASRALLGPLAIEDAAFSALCRDGRIEAGFSEARSLDGLVRGRAVASLAGRDVALRIDLSMSQLDLDPLAEVIGATGMNGTASGHLVAEAHGASPRALADSLAGHGQVSVRNGSLPALPSIADLSALGLDAPAWLRSRAVLPFDLATADLELAGNRLRIVDGRVVEPNMQQNFSAEASLLDRSFAFATAPSGVTGATVTNLAGVLASPPRILRAGVDPEWAPSHDPGLVRP